MSPYPTKDLLTANKLFPQCTRVHVPSPALVVIVPRPLERSSRNLQVSDTCQPFGFATWSYERQRTHPLTMCVVSES